MEGIDIVYLEQNVLKCCITNPDYILDIKEDLFLTEQGLNFYKVLKYLYTIDTPVNERNIIIEVSKREYKIQEKHISQLISLDVESDEKSFKRYAKELKEQKFKYTVANRILPLITRETNKSDFTLDSISELISDVQEDLYEINKESSKVYTPSEMFSHYENILYDRQDNIKNYSTGDSYMDNLLLEKFSPGKTTILFGPSGVGKSSFALFLVNRQLHKMIPSIYFTLEMTYESTMDRLVAQSIGVPVKYLYPTADPDSELESIPQNVIAQVKKLKDRFENSKFFELIEEDSLSISDIESRVKDFKVRNKVDYVVVTIDLLTMLKDFNVGSKSKADKYEDAMNLLHEMERRNNVHVVGVVQGRRPNERVNITNIEQLERFRPHIEELKNSGALEERARTVLGIFRRKHFANRYLPGDPEVEAMPDITEVDVLKQNMGRLGRIEYLFDPECYKFTKIIENEEIEINT